MPADLVENLSRAQVLLLGGGGEELSIWVVVAEKEAEGEDVC